MLNYVSTNSLTVNKVFLTNLRFSRINQTFLCIILLLLSLTTLAAEDDSAFGITNFAFASYLGTGFYTTSGQDVFVIQLPLDHTIREKTNNTAGIVLTLPVTIGLVNFGNIDVDDLPEVDDVATITFLPGIEYQYPVTANWTITPFADFGFARDLSNSSNVLVTGIGIKSYYNIPINSAMLSLGNKFLYAREQSNDTNNSSDYSLIETGLNYRVASDFTHKNGTVFSNLYYINFLYPNNLVFLERTDAPIRVGVEQEIGITFSNLPDFLFFEQAQIGFGVRFGNDVDIYRLVFGAPF